jgi:micrococcal nuclease
MLQYHFLRSMRGIWAVALTGMLAPPVWSHPGGLNAEGCHNDRKRGAYHCHNSSSASSPSGGAGAAWGSSVYIAPARSSTPRRRSSRSASPPPGGRVSLVSVGDGDTIRVATAAGQKVTVRLACIDAPETAQGKTGAMATQTLKKLLEPGNIEMRPQTMDKYGRTVAEVYANGRNVNQEMVRLGMAYAYRQYLGGCNADVYLNAEAQALQQRQGVWWYGDQVRPWDFRRNR